MPSSEPESPDQATIAERVLAYMRTPQFTKVWRYGTVSVVSTVVTLVSLYVFYRVLKVGSAGESNVLATAVATIPSYWLNRTWAWGKSGRSHLWREIMPFWVIAAIGLVLSTLAVQFASHEAKDLSAAHQVETALVLFANLFTYGVLWVGKFVLFNRFLFAKPPGDPPGEAPDAMPGSAMPGSAMAGSAVPGSAMAGSARAGGAEATGEVPAVGLG